MYEYNIIGNFKIYAKDNINIEQSLNFLAK